jgi:hypothetical protein
VFLQPNFRPETRAHLSRMNPALTATGLALTIGAVLLGSAMAQSYPENVEVVGTDAAHRQTCIATGREHSRPYVECVRKLMQIQIL